MNKTQETHLYLACWPRVFVATARGITSAQRPTGPPVRQLIQRNNNLFSVFSRLFKKYLGFITYLIKWYLEMQLFSLRAHLETSAFEWNGSVADSIM